MTHISPPLLRRVSLDDKYKASQQDVFMTGIEALVRLPMLQHEIDQHSGLNTAGFISGYRGSPLGGVDQALWKAKSYLEQHNIHFQPGVNEELAATSVWGSQQTGIVSESSYDGVFGMWYGKGPGVDRSMDAIKHANAFGTSQFGGVLAIAGDDHACKSSTLPHQSEHMFIGASVPVLAPANVQEVLDFGIFGWAMSRFTGCWVALKAITDNMDATMGVIVDPSRYSFNLPPAAALSPDGMHARWPDTPLDQERRLNKYKIYASRVFASINGINRIELDSSKPRLGIATSGKAYLDVMQALHDLGIDQEEANKLGIRVYKIGMPWPLDPEVTFAFANNLEEILVVEEKRSVIEDQLTSQLYNLGGAERPRIIGEFDEFGDDLLPNTGELTPDLVAHAIQTRLQKLGLTAKIGTAPKTASSVELYSPPCSFEASLKRTPHFCSGCPHNTSTTVPEGSVALGGIGCHYMATWMPDRDTRTFSQMGGEGAAWIGQAPFSQSEHVFQNLGDGTYFHSGSLAIRAAVASGINITYKILFNEAVAMTGGQALDGSLSLAQLVAQLKAEGVVRIALVSEEMNPQDAPLGVDFYRRADYDRLQREIRKVPGTSIIIYQQLCASEKRRRIKRGRLPKATERLIIHPEICEACGDCSKQSNCLSITPVDTPLGRKRQIDQHSCNTDLTCVKGYCPSFVSVIDGELASTATSTGESTVLYDPLPEPQKLELDGPWSGLVAGIGGTGVLTISSLIAMAAHLEGKGFATMNQTGLAQKFGAVVSHIKIAREQSDIHAVRVSDKKADLLIGCDWLVASAGDTLIKVNPDKTRLVLNHAEAPTSDFIHNPDLHFPADSLQNRIDQYFLETNRVTCDATTIARELLGDTIGANLFLVGVAYQQGLLPVSASAINQAIELNAVSVELNQSAFELGRRFVNQPEKVMAQIKAPSDTRELTFEELISDRYERLVNYHSESYGQEYLTLTESVRESDPRHNEGQSLSRIAATQLYRLMAIKDEYEVARLLTSASFTAQIKQQFGQSWRVNFHLAPPLMSRMLNRGSQFRKLRFGAWLKWPLRTLAACRRVRGSFLDVFAYSEDRREEYRDLERFKADIDLVVSSLESTNYELALALLESASTLRGFGHIRCASREKWLVSREQHRQALSLIADDAGELSTT